MLYTLRFFSSKCSLFHNANLFGSCIIHILYTKCAEIKKNNSGAKGLITNPSISRASSPLAHGRQRCTDHKPLLPCLATFQCGQTDVCWDKHSVAIKNPCACLFKLPNSREIRMLEKMRWSRRLKELRCWILVTLRNSEWWYHSLVIAFLLLTYVHNDMTLTVNDCCSVCDVM